LTLRQIQQPPYGISSSRRRSSCSLMARVSFSKCSGFSLTFARGLRTVATGGDARGYAISGAVAVRTGGGFLAICFEWLQVLRMASIYKSPGGSAVAR
jgi:hypothetical protein